ncbi:hypothetical protein [Candidatus Nanosynbacter sp. TM7-057]|mgnify:FL=1|uniref:hypothetical protein n=1 Tax=Candidatus Nanosynbacter sp. TM7-057 TaxID=2902630 RepID=UPI001FB6CC58|nr:hypothetical protein [Candidatus Nanosynbacter sp. TM7-057]MCJ1965183.1 hypothetical protein [Candidatus Nanosynbacter sp. TM7-057]
MSETVGRKGKLILCKKYKDADELEANLQEFWKSIPVEERGRYYKDVEEIEAYELEDNGYVVIDGNCIYKVELDKDFDAYDNFVEITQIQDGVYKFVTQFYNGSTDLQEMLQEGFDQTRKKMPMIYEVRVRVVKEGTVFVEAKTQDEAEKAATRDSVVSKPGFADTIEYYADEIYNADSTVDKSDIEIIKAEDVL